MAMRSFRSGYLLLTSFSAGPIEPASSPPLISWQERQLPLPRSNAIFCPWLAADCDCAEAGNAASDSASAAIAVKAGFLGGLAIKGIVPIKVYFGCIVSSGPVVRGVRFLPSAVEVILMSAAHALMQGLDAVSGRGSVQTKWSWFGILTFGKLSRSATKSLGTMSLRFRI